MRILLATDWAPLEGGVERYVAMLREGLEQAGDEVHLLTSSAGSAAGGAAEHVAAGSGHPAPKALLQLFNGSAWRAMRRAIRELRPDAVHLNLFLSQLSPAVLWPLGPIPTTLMVDGSVPICPTGTKLLPDGSACAVAHGAACRRNGCIGSGRALHARCRYAHFRSALKASVDHVWAISDWVHAEVERNGIASERIHLPVAAPSAGFTRRPASDPYFVFAGRLAPEKGVLEAIRAFSALLPSHPEAQLRIHGDGRLGPAVRAIIRDRGLERNVSLFPQMSPDWVCDLAPAWAAIVPSTYPEPLGLVAVEAISHGVPVIASRTGGLPETVEDGVSGILVPAGDEAALARAIEEIASRRAFAEHSVPRTVVERLQRRHDRDAHIARFRHRLAELAGKPA